MSGSTQVSSATKEPKLPRIGSTFGLHRIAASSLCTPQSCKLEGFGVGVSSWPHQHGSSHTPHPYNLPLLHLLLPPVTSFKFTCYYSMFLQLNRGQTTSPSSAAYLPVPQIISRHQTGLLHLFFKFASGTPLRSQPLPSSGTYRIT